MEQLGQLTMRGDGLREFEQRQILPGLFVGAGNLNGTGTHVRLPRELKQKLPDKLMISVDRENTRVTYTRATARSSLSDHNLPLGEIRSSGDETLQLTNLELRPITSRTRGRQVAKLATEEVTVMLRITLCNESENIRLVVEGKLAGASLSELEKSWQKAVSNESKCAIVVDLSCVSFVDTSGKELLKRMRESGIRFVGMGIMPKCLIEEIESATVHQRNSDSMIL
jgi:anti-anti-sigma regulatory factor